jgi:alpha-soluble NSF attachment protein
MAHPQLKGWGVFSNRYEDAAEYWEKAANNYKLGKAWPDASECYMQLAACNLQLDSKHDAATSFVEASKCAAKGPNPAQAPKLLQKAVALYTDLGRLNMAARQLREIAEMAEKSDSKAEAMLYYDQAADLFETEGSTSEAAKCKLKIAEFAAEAGDFVRACAIFEDAARRAVDNHLLKARLHGVRMAQTTLRTHGVKAVRTRTPVPRMTDVRMQPTTCPPRTVLRARLPPQRGHLLPVLRDVRRPRDKALQVQGPGHQL